METYPKIGSFELTPGVITALVVALGPTVAGAFGAFNGTDLVFQCVVAAGVFLTVNTYLIVRAYVVGKNKEIKQAETFSQQ